MLVLAPVSFLPMKRRAQEGAGLYHINGLADLQHIRLTHRVKTDVFLLFRER